MKLVPRERDDLLVTHLTGQFIIYHVGILARKVPYRDGTNPRRLLHDRPLSVLSKIEGGVRVKG